MMLSERDRDYDHALTLPTESGAPQNLCNSPIQHSILSSLQYRLAQEEGEEVDFTHAITTHLGLRLRLMEARRKIFATARKKGRRYWIGDRHILRFQAALGRDRLFAYMDQISQELALIAERPLTPRQLVEIVSITSQERLRWTKDGRLPACGVSTLKHRHQVAMPVYSVALAEQLMAEPSLIHQWRANDAILQDMGLKNPV
ncbi:MAG: hypothetical protein QM690_01380 [Sphingobium sp.]